MPEQSHSPLISNQKNNIAYLTLNRPTVLNALNKSLLIEIKNELETIKTNPDVKAVVITGAGDKAFSAGVDIAYLNQASPLQV